MRSSLVSEKHSRHETRPSHITVLCTSCCVFVIVTQSGVVLSHLNFFNTVSRKPTSSSFNAAFPEPPLTYRQNCSSTTHTHNHYYNCTHTKHSAYTQPRCLTFHPLSSVQLDLARPLGDVGPDGDEGASRDGAVQPPLPHLGGRGGGGRGTGLHVTSGARAADRQTTGRQKKDYKQKTTPPNKDTNKHTKPVTSCRVLCLNNATHEDHVCVCVWNHRRVPESPCVASERVCVRVVVSLQALEGGARRGGGAFKSIVTG